MKYSDEAPCSVLLIDDESIAQEFIRYSLENYPKSVLHFYTDANNVVALAEKVHATVIILDLHMPGADGFEIIDQLCKSESTADIPIILLSTEENAEIKSRAFFLGVDDYLVKWPDPRELAARIHYQSNIYFTKKQRDEAFLELKRNQEKLRISQDVLYQAQKMEAIGQLTGGIAHDFNNILQVISCNLQIVKMMGGLSEVGRSRIDIALSGIERGARLASNLLAYAKRQPLQTKIVNPTEILNDIKDILRSAINPHLELIIENPSNIWNVEIDPNQLQNVILNLAINARDAMPNPGVLTIRISNIQHDSPELNHFESDDYVLIEVIDTGIGMPPEVVKRAFEPFFTTKPAGHGTGLGLSMAYGFIKQSGGEIILKSAIGSGTNVQIFLRKNHVKTDTENHSENALLHHSNESILVVEDEEGIRAATVSLLTELGYKVFSAENADEAIDMLENGLEVDLVFSDMKMPGKMSCFDLSKKLHEKSPAAKILFTSGYSENFIQNSSSEIKSNILQKPYTIDILSERIHKLLSTNY